ncbi:RHS repeat-associated core domain-containing protein [Fimbriimonadia bacterium ATM]|nr:MAG: RHS repeat-associated core domain-containing protein [Armatimonadota bacterium]MBC6970904.1 RHS repeat-associated core domain-containing protein [Armatimonadota bacterium]MCE7901024.1 RHS repeat-associated core domain-containing protein [Armatimonadetes bacterium ATM1]MDL1929886.1 RHS repeat-associated core domain-containing protein [Fimbriimonadia bacterium ATM]RIJ94094.1 MAG: hypothetical protein DCC45_13095 [Armatimonadota bacterium]
MTSVTSSGQVTSLTYDYEDRVTSIAYPGGGANTFAYSGLGARVSKTDSTGSYTYRRNGSSVTSPVLSDGSAVYTPGISERRSGVSRFYHSDLKNGVQQTDSSQTFAAVRAYDAFGMPVSSSGPWAGPFGYGGKFGYQSDPDSGLMLLGHRYYDPSTGRFLTRDPIKDGRNWYAYCEGDPLVQFDAAGEAPYRIKVPGADVIIEIDLHQKPFPNAHIVNRQGRRTTMIRHDGTVPSAHGGKPNPPIPRKLWRALHAPMEGKKLSAWEQMMKVMNRRAGSIPLDSAGRGLRGRGGGTMAILIVATVAACEGAIYSLLYRSRVYGHIRIAEIDSEDPGNVDADRAFRILVGATDVG